MGPANRVACVLVLLCACARPGPKPTSFLTAGDPSAALLLIGPRTMLIETTAQLNSDSSGRQEHRLILGGELAELAVDRQDEDAARSRLEALVRYILGDTNLTLVDLRRESPGKLTLRLEKRWEELEWAGDLRVVNVPLSFESVVVPTFIPVTAEAREAMDRGQKSKPPEFWPAARIEHRYRMKLPDGFRARDPGASVKRQTDGAVLERRLAMSPSGIEGSILFEISKPRLPSKQLETMFQEVQDAEAGAVGVKVEMIAETLQANGKLVEAFKETQRLVDAHGDDGFYHLKHAISLVDAGLVEAGRAEARRAVEKAPKLAYAHQILAWSLERDLLGRPFGPGYDRAGAIEARRQQLALTGPKGRGASDLAKLLSRNERGNRLAAGAPLDEILHLTAELDGMDDATAELRTQILLRLDRGAEAEKAVREHLGDKDHQGYLLAAIARARGVDAAIAELPVLGLSGDAAALPMSRAANLLVTADVYPLAAALASAGARITHRLQRLADDMSRLCKPRGCKPDSNPALETLKRLLRSCIDAATFERIGRPLLDARNTERPPGQPEVKNPKESLYEATCRTVMLRTSWPPPAWSLDAEATDQFESDGDTQIGYRARPTVAPSGTTASTRTFFFSEQGGQARFLGPGPYVAAEEALRLALAGRTKPAAVWLGWSRELLPSGSIDNSPATALALDALWAGQPADLEPIREAAAAVTAYNLRQARKAIPPLEQALAGAREPRKLQVLLQALASAHQLAGDAKAADRLAEGLRGPDASDTQVAALRASIAARAGNCPKALALQRELSQRSTGTVTNRRLMTVAISCQSLDDSITQARKITGMSNASAADHNNLAWHLAVAGKAGDEALTSARLAVQRTSRQSPSLLHTLALVAAQTGNLAESRAAVSDMLQRTPPGTSPPDESSVWLVVGATAEALGLTHEAIKAYRRVERPPRPALNVLSGHLLAERRLAALTAKAP